MELSNRTVIPTSRLRLDDFPVMVELFDEKDDCLKKELVLELRLPNELLPPFKLLLVLEKILDE